MGRYGDKHGDHILLLPFRNLLCPVSTVTNLENNELRIENNNI